MSRRSGRRNTTKETESNDAFDATDDELEVTRCVCALDELDPTSVLPEVEALLWREYRVKVDHGLFIQCEKCLLWQHGYCVGLFSNSDVPDEYWCEQCKPDLHIVLYDGDRIVRTLYQPVNKARERIKWQDLAAGLRLGPSHKPTRLRGPKRSSPGSLADPSSERSGSNAADGTKPHARKERRHYEGSYEEQIEKALHLSAKESGILISLPADSINKHEEADPIEDNKVSPPNERKRSADPPELVKTEHPPEREHDRDRDREPESHREQDLHSALDTNDKPSTAKSTGHTAAAAATTTAAAATPSSESRGSPTKPKRSRFGAKSKRLPAPAATPPLSNDELVHRPSKPRFVSDRLSMHDLRKRTSAILEWLGQRQSELEEGRSVLLSSYEAVQNTVPLSVLDQHQHVEARYSSNLTLVASLTERVLAWERNFGKYAM